MKIKFIQYLLLLLLAGNAAIAQQIAVNTNDAATGTRVIITKNHAGSTIVSDDTVVKTGLVFFSAGYQKTMINQKEVETYFIDLDIFHNNNKLGCIKQGESNIVITLEDGTEINGFQISDTECNPQSFKAAFAIAPKGATTTVMAENFKKMQNSPIAKIKITSTEGFLNYKIRSGSSKYIKDHFALVQKTLNSGVK